MSETPAGTGIAAIDDGSGNATYGTAVAGGNAASSYTQTWTANNADENHNYETFNLTFTFTIQSNG